MTKDQEIADVATQLNDRMDELAATVAALNAILTRPAPPAPGSDERLVSS
jgi:hypothetical protein